LTLLTFTLDDDEPRLLQGGESIIRDDRVVGVVSSGGYGHTVGKTIAMGYLSAADAQEKGDYCIEVYQERIPASRHIGSLYDPERRRIFS